MARSFVSAYTLSDFADRLGHATLDMLAALSRQLKLQSWKHLLYQLVSGTVPSKLSEFVDSFGTNLGFTIAQESDIMGKNVGIYLLLL